MPVRGRVWRGAVEHPGHAKAWMSMMRLDYACWGVAAHVGAWTGIGWHDVACQFAAGYGALWSVMAGLARSSPCRAIGCHGFICGAMAS
jgi:hypothetical protein